MQTVRTLDELRDSVSYAESADRFRHTLGVEQEVASLGEILLPNAVQSLRAAALLHDLTKGFSPEEQFLLCEEYGIPLTDELRKSPQVLHGITAARRIPILYPAFATEEILHAVAVHTTGDAKMSLFDKILFVADYTESGRTYDACRNMRKRLWEEIRAAKNPEHSFDGIVLAILKETINYLNHRGMPIVSATIAAYQALSRTFDEPKSKGEPMEQKQDFTNASPRVIADELIRLLYRKGATDIQLFEVTEDTSLTDYHLIATGRSSTHIKSLGDELNFEMSERGINVRSVEGKSGGNWILLDFISVIVHIFDATTREFYCLERLQNPSHRVDISSIIESAKLN